MSKNPRSGRLKTGGLTLKLNDTRAIKPQPRHVSERATYDEYRTEEYAAFREAVLGRAGGRCQGCGQTGKKLYADHVVELRDGGTHDPKNGRALCGSCHVSKTLRVRGQRMGTIPGRNPFGA